MRILGIAMIAFAAMASTVSVNGKNRVVVDKPASLLYVINDAGDTIFTTAVTVGTNFGQKTKVGDRKTPEGTFPITQIQNASAWTHDFRDGGGVRKGAYGPYFHRLGVPGNNSIGIHGTCFPDRLGKRDSEGCIRMQNDSLKVFRTLVEVGTKVTVLPDRKNVSGEWATPANTPVKAAKAVKGDAVNTQKECCGKDGKHDCDKPKGLKQVGANGVLEAPAGAVVPAPVKK